MSARLTARAPRAARRARGPPLPPRVAGRARPPSGPKELGAFDALCEALVCVQGAAEMGAPQLPREQAGGKSARVGKSSQEDSCARGHSRWAAFSVGSRKDAPGGSVRMSGALRSGHQPHRLRALDRWMPSAA